jgi:dsRNA-specific ribonuclease
MKLLCPTAPPKLDSMTLFWDNETTYTVEFETAQPVDLTHEDVESMRTITALYLQASTTRPLPADRDYITLFTPDVPPSELPLWLEKHNGHEPAQDVFTSNRHPELMGIVRDHARFGEVLIFKRWVDSGTDVPLSLECDSYPKRRNLLQQQTLATSTKRSTQEESPPATENEQQQRLLESPTKKRIISADQCTIDKLPATETIFGRFIPVIIDRLEVALVATKLCETILHSVRFNDMRHVITAITMPSAQAPSNYQRYEFFGDSVLKFTVSFSLFYQHPTWHEGYLSEGRDAIVQNGRLARAALTLRLDSFIIGKMFTPRRWAAPLIGEKMATGTTTKREMSTKVLADVVEALIGAAYIDGGHVNAQACLRTFLPELQITTPDIAMAQRQNSNHPEFQPRLIHYELLEENIGYTFSNKTLLTEALTHPSCQHDSATQSYQRLEFLGDAVLDMIIVDLIVVHSHQNQRQIPQGEMTRIKHALVNANLLAFFCLDFGWDVPGPEVVVSTSSGDNQLETVATSTTHHLYTYLRHSLTMPILTTLRTKTLPRYDQQRPAILTHLNTPSPPQSAHILPPKQNNPKYPWTALATLHPEKFLSDMIESLLGAIFIDSAGDMAACSGFLEKLGLLRYARYVLDHGVDVVHPLQRAQIFARSDVKFKTLRVVRAVGEMEAENEGGDSEESGSGSGSGSEQVAGEEEAEATYTCTATLPSHDIEDIVVSGCLSSEEAEIRAAEAVIAVLSSAQGSVVGADLIGDEHGIGIDGGLEKEMEVEVEMVLEEEEMDGDKASAMEF